eukprot:6183843-Pleurochrysis_carterae.AAC.1
MCIEAESANVVLDLSHTLKTLSSMSERARLKTCFLVLESDWVPSIMAGPLSNFRTKPRSATCVLAHRSHVSPTDFQGTLRGHKEMKRNESVLAGRFRPIWAREPRIRVTPEAAPFEISAPRAVSSICK